MIFIACLAVSYVRFGFPFSIKYESGDSAVHFLTADIFSKEDKLLNNVKDELYGRFSARKIGSYVNSGLIMKCFEGAIDEIYNYRIFIGFGIFILFMTGSMMYSTLEKFAKNNFGKIISLVVSLIFVMGYPLNSLLFGFEYMSLGLLVLCTLLHLVYYFEKEEFKRPFLLFMFALVNFGLFCSYYMFIPFTYSALWIYFCIYSYRKNKKIICKENIVTLTITLLLPFFLGYAYHLAPGIYNIFNMDLKDALESSVNYSSSIASSFDLDRICIRKLLLEYDNSSATYNILSCAK